MSEQEARIPKYRFELLIPLNHNDGTPIDPQILIDIKDELLERLGEDVSNR